MPDRAPLVLVSNRGPVTFQEDGSIKRGTGGLVTALTGLASHRDAIWIASAMTDRDVEVTAEHDGKPFEVEAPADQIEADVSPVGLGLVILGTLCIAESG